MIKPGWVKLLATLTAVGAVAMLIYFRPLLTPSPPGAEQVILLHGLGRSEMAMLPLANQLADAGYEVHNIGYDSNKLTPEQIVAVVTDEMNRCCLSAPETLNFVGHSLGGLVIRAILERHKPANLGRVVLIGTPNHGSELADDEEGIRKTFAEWAGPTAQALGTGPDSFPASLPPPDYEVAVIAGSGDNPVTNQWLPVPNDSMVTVESTRLEGMKDFLIVDSTHSGLRHSYEVAEQAINFLRTGSFSK